MGGLWADLSGLCSNCPVNQVANRGFNDRIRGWFWAFATALGVNSRVMRTGATGEHVSG
jgi:hypothetical protein